MSQLCRPVRILTLLLLALQCALPALVSVADGTRARASRNAIAHIEETGTSECSPAHSADCELCQFLSGGLCAPPETREFRDAPAHVAVRTEPVLPLVATAPSGFNSRAPPPATV